jgi:hypothetical protein
MALQPAVDHYWQSLNHSIHSIIQLECIEYHSVQPMSAQAHFLQEVIPFRKFEIKFKDLLFVFLMLILNSSASPAFVIR